MKNSVISVIIAVLCMAGLESCQSFDTPNSVSYTLIANLDGLVDGGSLLYFEDSLLFAQIFALDQVVYLSTKCGETYNTDFSGGWKISLKKGSPDDGPELSAFTSAGKDAGLNGSRVYTAFQYNPDSSKMPEYDIRYSFTGYSKSSASVSGLYIKNTEAVERLCLNGEVVPGDFLKVILHE